MIGWWLENLKEFISTDQRKIVFLEYVLADKPLSPTEIKERTKMPLSSVDRIVSTLKTMGMLLKQDEKIEAGMKKNYYEVNWTQWIRKSMKSSGIDVSEENLEKLETILKDKISVIFFYLLPEATRKLMLDMLKKPTKKHSEEEINFLKLIFTQQKSPNIVEYPIFEFYSVSYSLISDVTSLFGEKDFDEKILGPLMKKYIMLLNEELDEKPALKKHLGKITEEEFMHYFDKKKESKAIYKKILYDANKK